MRIHYFQHVAFEDPAYILTWAQCKGHSLAKTRLDQGDKPLEGADFDLLVVMGGPMNIYEYDKFPWLKAEKQAIRTAIDSHKYVLGICLGAQLIADVLGAHVTTNREKEIGWLRVVQADEISAMSPFDALPRDYIAFHWHGDTFSIPQGAVLQGSSIACKNQGFIYKDTVIGLQYHIEATPASIEALIDNCSQELVTAPNVHPTGKIRDDARTYCATANCLVDRMLDRWFE
jgi:GMP synthase-like glutamine amidotransferase